MSRGATDWTYFDETLGTGIQLGLEIESVVYRSQTGHQELAIYQTTRFGRVMALDGVLQVCERDEFIYHEMLAHVPLFAHGEAKRVCIVGGGDGGMLREALRHPVEQATLVEIDRQVIDLCRDYLPTISNGAFDDPRTNLVVADGRTFMDAGGDCFDVIIVDSTDPIGPGEALFTSDFYGACKARLNAGGVLVTQSGVVMIQGRELADTVRRQRRHFVDVTAYIAAVPTYVGGHMAFGWASDDRALRRLPLETLQARYDAREIATRYYNPATHLAAFALPNYVAQHVGAS